MYIITGATGHIGSIVAETLLSKGEKVMILTRSQEKGETWKKKGADVAVIDVNDTSALHAVFMQGKRLFLLNPPAMPDSDMFAEEHKTMRSILKALGGTQIEKVVAQSTYGAQPGKGSGDLNTLFDMEQGLDKTGIPATIIRGAYYMTNWDMQLDTAQSKGIIYTMFPAGFMLPMIAPADLGELAAKLLLQPVTETGLYYVEGPQRYSSADVAEAFGEALHKRVEAVEIPESQWTPSLEQLGFSEEAARSMAGMTSTTLHQHFELPDEPYRGKTSLKKYISQLVNSTVAAQV
ncbi:MAG: NAD-dependent epimerase/dehydratase family protein [Sphingobacteriales bacterium]|nr:MAG: NAD-dependent epimerase/dehydratase family protein [Sphingobacteriales bacterium]